jgi:phospholipase C
MKEHLRPRFLGLVITLVALIELVGCQGLKNSTSTGTGSINKLNHIIFMLQENRSFDNYFGSLNDYRQAHGLSANVDGTPSNASVPSYDGTTTFVPFHMVSMCTEDLSDYWNESHVDWNLSDPTSSTPAMDGFAHSAGNFSINQGGYDTEGQRVMGYYNDQDLPYYYYMATQFAISDRWFSPMMSNTPGNRLYAMAATSNGFVGNPGPNKINVPTIFDELQAAGITWKNYVPDFPNGSSLIPFPTYQKYLNTNIVPISQYFTDLQNGTLPQVAFIDRDSSGGNDEHPGAGSSVQKGSAYVESIVNALMQSSAWKDSVFFLTFDEAGGMYDHVPPVQTVSPDGIPPSLAPSDICTASNDSTTLNLCDFDVTGFRLPNIVISPFSKSGYVDHTAMDTTVILKFIEERFGLKPLTARDAAQPDISSMFDFTNPPNMNPSTPPSQPTNGPCYVNSLP